MLAWLEAARGTYDLIVLDPPSFSARSKMERRFEVQRDHPRLIARTLERLAKGGTLYFSTNYRGFELDPALDAEEVTPRARRLSPRACTAAGASAR